MNFRKILSTILFLLCLTQVFSEDLEVELTDYKFSVISPWHTFLNWIGEDIEMYELHVNYDITPKDTIGIKVATWKIFEPMGIQLWDPNLMKKSEWFSGRIWERGIGITYQRYLWKGFFTSVEVMPMNKIFLDPDGKQIAQGFRLYTSLHVGYHFSFLNDRIFIEPQIHCNYWPINTKGPNGFREKVEEYDNFLLFEPNIYFGVSF
jgi:hypothetical protein